MFEADCGILPKDSQRTQAMSTLILFNKPYGVLSRFTDDAGRPTLAQYVPRPNVYPAGRLDADSEGLLLLTDDGRLQRRISDPQFKLPKTYWAQVEGIAEDSRLAPLRSGIAIRDYRTRPAQVDIIPPPALWPRTPPIRVRKNIPTSWLALTIREGRNRQVRHMTAAVGYPTLRLIRVCIGDWRLGELTPGQWREITV